MKNKIALVFCIPILLGQYLFAQANLTTLNCYRLQATYQPISLAKANIGSYSFLLEKELIPGIWKKIKNKESKKTTTLFAN